MNVARMQFIREELNLPESRVVDIGCGGGLLSESLARLGATVTGIDPSNDLLEAAKSHAELDDRLKIDYRSLTAEELALESPGAFDAVFLLEVIEHVPRPESLLEAVATLVKPKGKLFLSTMSPTLQSYLVTIVGAEYLFGYLPPGTHDWNSYLSPSQVRSLLQPYGWKEQRVEGMVPTNMVGVALRGKPVQWKLDASDTSVNWIGVYEKV